MSEKIFNARFAQKIDTLTAWASSNIVLKAGEIAFATTAASTGSGLTEPVIVAKIGDGSKTFGQLDYNFYAKASDVYGWAKKDETAHKADLVTWFPTSVEGLAIVDGNLQATKRDGTTYSLPLATDAELAAAIQAVEAKIGDLTKLATENKTDLVTAINEVRQAVEVGGTGSVVTITDANANKVTTYTVKQGETEVKKILVPDAYDDTALATRVKNIEDDYTTGSEFNGWLTNTYNVKVGEIEQAIEDAAKAGTDAAAAEKERAEGVEAGLAERLTGTEGVANAAKAAIDAFLDENAATDEVVNTLKEIQAGLDAGEESAASLLAEINKIKGGETVVSNATHAVNADTAAQASGLNDAGIAAVKAVKVDNAGHADSADNATKLNGQEASYYATAANLAQEITDRGTAIANLTKSVADTYETKEDAQNMLTNISKTINDNKEAANEGIAQANNYTSMVEGQVTDLNNSLAPVAKSGKLSDLDKTFGEGITDIIFDAGNASGYNA